MRINNQYKTMVVITVIGVGAWGCGLADGFKGVFSDPVPPQSQVSVYDGAKIDQKKIINKENVTNNDVQTYFEGFFSTATTITPHENESCESPHIFYLEEEVKQYYTNKSDSIDYSIFYKSVELHANGEYIDITFKGIPNHPTGFFLNEDRQPMCQIFSTGDEPSINKTIKIPLKNEVTFPTPLSPGIIGIALNGVPLVWDPSENNFLLKKDQYNGLSKDGHYYYQMEPVYFTGNMTNSQINGGVKTKSGASDDSLIGFALDGFPLYGIKDEINGKKVRPTDLDSCGGHVGHTRDFHTLYHYHVQDQTGIQSWSDQDYPLIKCFSGAIQ